MAVRVVKVLKDVVEICEQRWSLQFCLCKQVRPLHRRHHFCTTRDTVFPCGATRNKGTSYAIHRPRHHAG